MKKKAMMAVAVAVAVAVVVVVVVVVMARMYLGSYICCCTYCVGRV